MRSLKKPMIDVEYITAQNEEIERIGARAQKEAKFYRSLGKGKLDGDNTACLKPKPRTPRFMQTCVSWYHWSRCHYNECKDKHCRWCAAIELYIDNRKKPHWVGKILAKRSGW